MSVAQLCLTLCGPMDCVARQALLCMGFSRQEYWSGLPFPSPGDLSNPGIKPTSPTLWADSLPSEPPGKPLLMVNVFKEKKKKKKTEGSGNACNYFYFRFLPLLLLVQVGGRQQGELGKTDFEASSFKKYSVPNLSFSHLLYLGTTCAQGIIKTPQYKEEISPTHGFSSSPSQR